MAALGDGAVAGRVERHDLLDGGRATLLQLDGELVSHEPGLLDQPALGLGDLAALQQPGAGRQGGPHPRLRRLDLQVDRLVVDLALAQCPQVAAVQVAVPPHPRVDHCAVQTRTDLERARPVLGGELGLQAGQMLVLAADEPALDQTGPPAVRVMPGQPAGERPVPHVQLEAVVIDLGLLQVEPRPARHPELQ